MPEYVETRPSSQVPPHELPASLRDAGLADWIREPLDNAVDRRRRIIMPPAAATMGTPAIAGLLSANHGYWGAQLVAPYVEEEVAWAIEKHEALRYFPDESVGYRYPEAYIGYFGADYHPPEYIRREHEAARRHRWYMTSRLITINDIYSFDPDVVVDFDEFEDVVGRNFRQPAEGLGFDGSPVAHMWRTMIWPNNFL